MLYPKRSQQANQLVMKHSLLPQQSNWLESLLLILLVPFCAWLGRRIGTEEAEVTGFPVPYFVPGFVIAACLTTWVLPESIATNLTDLGTYMLLPLLAAVGFFINKKSMQNAGGPVFLVGLLSTLLMVGVSYAILTCSGNHQTMYDDRSIP